MNKAELVSQVAEQTKTTKADAERVIEAVFASITKTLSQGEEARFVGFGTFAVRKREARKGHNPRTKEPIDIPAAKLPVFRPGKELKASVN